MQKPICTEPVAGFSFTILEQEQPVPVSLAGYRLREGRQYCLRVKSNNPSVRIQNVILENDESIKDHFGNYTDGGYIKKFEVTDNSWWKFLPFRFLSSTMIIRAEIDIKEGGSRPIYVPIIMVHFFPAVNTLYWLWYACGAAIFVGLPYLLYQLETQVSAIWIQVLLFLGILLVAPVIAVFWQFRILKRKAKDLRNFLLNDSNDEEMLEVDAPEK